MLLLSEEKCIGEYMSICSIPEIFGSMVFNDKIMKERLSKDAYKEFCLHPKVCEERYGRRNGLLNYKGSV